MSCTNMSPAITYLRNLMQTLTEDGYTHVKLFTLSDGEIHDIEQTIINAAGLNFPSLEITSHAIRLKTGETNNADTRALACLLRLNTRGANVNLVDVNGDDTCESALSSLFDTLKKPINQPINQPKDNKADPKDSKVEPKDIKAEPKDSKFEPKVIKADLKDNKAEPKDDKVDNKDNKAMAVHFDIECKTPILIPHVPWNDLITNTRVKINNDEDLQFWIQMDQKQAHGSSIKINGTTFELNISKEEMSYDQFQIYMKPQFHYYTNQAALLKVINSVESKDTIEKMVNYFHSMENLFLHNRPSKDGKVSTKLQDRLSSYVRVLDAKKKSISFRLSQIANDDKLAFMNSSQQANYLRTISKDANDKLSKAAKGVVKRFDEMGTDYDPSIRQEIKTMHSKLSELSNIDDSKHQVSFYSNETTLGGIKAICSLVDKGLVDSLPLLDICKLCNIVGTAIGSTVSDFPDPMTWRVNKIYPGVYFSWADMLECYSIDGKKEIKVYNSEDVITGVIPVFDDDKIHMFLKTHAPVLLNFLAGLGMRRMMAHIPLTYNYTMVAGFWKMMEVVDHNPSQINCETLWHIGRAVQLAMGRYFKHVNELLHLQNTNKTKTNTNTNTQTNTATTKTDNKTDNKTDTKTDTKLVASTNSVVSASNVIVNSETSSNLLFSLGNNGITNMIPVLMQESLASYSKATENVVASQTATQTATQSAAVTSDSLKERFVSVLNGIPNYHLILRALYTFEIYQIVRKINRDSKTPEPDNEKLVQSLLSIDPSKHPLPLTKDVFQDDWTSVQEFLYCTPVYNMDVFTNIQKKYWFLKQLNNYLEYIAVIHFPMDQAVALMKTFEKFSPERLYHQLQLDIKSEYDIKDTKSQVVLEYELSLVIQALKFSDLASRMDKEANKMMKINDMANERVRNETLQSLVRHEHEREYNSRYSEKKKQQHQQAVKALIEKLVDEKTSIEQFDALLLNGLEFSLKPKISKSEMQALADSAFKPIQSVSASASISASTSTSASASASDATQQKFSSDQNQSQVDYKSKKDKNTPPTPKFVKTQFSNVYDLGAKDLSKALMNLEPTALNNRKIKHYLLGKRDDATILWNNGNFVHSDFESFQKFFTDQEWQTLLLKTYHQYREKENRHSHKNDKRSFWALKYASYDDMASKISSEELQEYDRLHHDCCRPFTARLRAAQRASDEQA